MLGTEERVRRKSGFASVSSCHPVLLRVAHAFVPDGCDLIPGEKQIGGLLLCAQIEHHTPAIEHDLVIRHGAGQFPKPRAAISESQCAESPPEGVIQIAAAQAAARRKNGKYHERHTDRKKTEEDAADHRDSNEEPAIDQRHRCGANHCNLGSDTCTRPWSREPCRTHEQPPSLFVLVTSELMADH